MLLCPRCRTESAMSEEDTFGKRYFCPICGWSKDGDQVIILGKKIIVTGNPEKILSETSRTKGSRRRNPQHGRMRL